MKVLQIGKIMHTAGTKLMRCKPIAKAVHKVSKNKPEILAVGGGIFILTAFGWAIYEAVTVKDTLEESTSKVKRVEAIKKDVETRDDISEEEKTTQIIECQKTIRDTRTEAILVVVRKFAGPTALLLIGMKMGTDGFKILRAENIFLAGALRKKDDLFNFYRGNVRQDLGEDADKKYMRGITGEQTIEETKVDENGKEKVVKTKVPVIKDHENPWRFKFDEENFDSWQGDTDLNLFYLKCAQDWWNHEYNNQMFVSMYEILKYMRYRFDRVKAKMTKKQWKEFIDFLRNYGWWKGSNGDGFIDFGVYRAVNEAAIRRLSDDIYVEFNCDGCLQDM